jgi:transcriptional regulator with XRE-family HTH domain
MNLKDKLIALRKAQKLTQKQLSERIHYSDKVISKWERGESYPDIEALKTLALYYNVTIDSLVNHFVLHSRVPNRTFKKLEVKKTQQPHLVFRWFIIVPFIFLVATILLDQQILPSLFIFVLLLLPNSLIWTQYTFEGQHEDHIIKVSNTTTLSAIYIDDILVESIHGLFHINPIRIFQIDGLLVRVKMNNLLGIKVSMSVINM